MKGEALAGVQSSHPKPRFPLAGGQRKNHVTILHLMGIDHTKLTYRFSGRDFRLTDVSGKVINDIIA
jgi:hypothetical protein